MNTTTDTTRSVGTCSGCGCPLYDHDGMLVDALNGYDCDGDGRTARVRYPTHRLED